METRGTSPQSADDSTFRMIDVGEKAITRRRAVAKGRINMAPATVQRVADKKMPKGDVLALAEVAGIMAAKNTSNILPLCHPLGMDSVRVWCEIGSESITAYCEAICHGKTGVEMEALVGVTAALMCIYDLTKGIDPVLSVSDIHLQRKEGGKSGLWTHPIFPESAPTTVGEAHHTESKKTVFAGLKAAVLTMSDRTFRGESEDASGPLLVEYLKGKSAGVVDSLVLPDDKSQIQEAVRRLVRDKGVELLLTTGGTGLGPRDVTPEAVREIASKSVQGLGELLREYGAKYMANSWLSRSEAFLVDSCLVVLLPGSPKAVRQGLEAIGELLPHAISMLRGGNHETTKGAQV